MMADTRTTSAALSRVHLRMAAIIVAVLGIIAAALGWSFSPLPFYRAYLHGWLLWLDVSLGAMAMTMVIHLLGGSWGRCIRRLAESAALLLPLLAVLFIPIAIGAGTGALFPGIGKGGGGAGGSDPLLEHRHVYLNYWFFIGRAAFYFACWIPFAVLLRWGSKRGSIDGHNRPSTFLTAISGPGLFLYILTMGLFAATDWILSLEPNYKSTVFGLIIVTGQGVSAMCVLIAGYCLLAPRPAIRSDDLNDLASVLLTVTMLCCYLILCQYVINWMGNSQTEVRWYLHRLSNGWLVLSIVVIALQLVMPLCLLLIRRIKTSRIALTVICLVLLGARGLDGFIMTNAGGGDAAALLRSRFSWLDVAMPIAIGGIWVAAFLTVLGAEPVIADMPAATGESLPQTAEGAAYVG